MPKALAVDRPRAPRQPHDASELLSKILRRLAASDDALVKTWSKRLIDGDGVSTDRK